jgi:hypothetical protein
MDLVLFANQSKHTELKINIKKGMGNNVESGHSLTSFKGGDADAYIPVNA